jgi:hypothetical protein
MSERIAYSRDAMAERFVQGRDAMTERIAHQRDAVTERLHGGRDWLRRTFGRSVSRRWLHTFWREYAQNRWQLLFNPLAYRWHFKMVPYAVSEVVYTLRFAARLPWLVRSTTR